MGKLGEAIRDQRKQLKLKVYELAKKINVHPTYITYIEKHNRLPSLEIIAKLEKVLGINLQDPYFKEKHPRVTLNFLIKNEDLIMPQMLEHVLNTNARIDKQYAAKLLVNSGLAEYESNSKVLGELIDAMNKLRQNYKKLKHTLKIFPSPNQD